MIIDLGEQINRWISPHLLRGHGEVLDPHVDDLVDVDAGDDEEDPRPPRPPGQDPAKAEDDRLLVLLPPSHRLH